MAWCEANRVDFLFGLARNERLEQAIKPELGHCQAIRGWRWVDCRARLTA